MRGSVLNRSHARSDEAATAPRAGACDYLLVVGPGRSGSTFLYRLLKGRTFESPAIKDAYYYRSQRRFERALRRIRAADAAAVLLDVANLAWRDPRLMAGVAALRRRGALDAAGGFDETFARNQDYELNWRLRQRGETVWFDPALEVAYRPRGSLAQLARQYHDYGRWKQTMLRRHPASLRWRQLAAPGLVSALAVSALLAVGAALAGLRRRVAVAALVPLALAVMHLSWGAGSCCPGSPAGGRADDPDARPRATAGVRRALRGGAAGADAARGGAVHRVSVRRRQGGLVAVDDRDRVRALAVLAVAHPAWRPPRSWLLAVLAAGLGVSVLSACFGVSVQRSLWSTYLRMQGVVDRRTGSPPRWLWRRCSASPRRCARCWAFISPSAWRCR